MLNKSTSTNRYSDKDLAEFKIHVEQKLQSARQQVNSFEERIESISESNGNDGDWMDDTSSTQDLEMLYGMVSRQQKHIRDLENALIRIHNKSYGICVVSGELIDKRRLMAVPTTTKSLAAKTAIAEKTKDEPREKKKPKASQERKTISRVIKRTGGTPVVKPKLVEDDFFDDDDDDDDDYDNDGVGDVDLDSIADESTVEE